MSSNDVTQNCEVGSSDFGLAAMLVAVASAAASRVALCITAG